MALASIDRTAALGALVERGVVSGAVAAGRTLPLPAPLRPLLPHGLLQRGTVIGCRGPAAVSVALAVAAGPAAEGAWVGVAGLPALGVGAAVGLGVPAERLVLVAGPKGATAARFDDERWAEVLSAMVDGFDVVLVGHEVTASLRAGSARRIAARVQARGVVLLTIDAGSGDVGSGAAGEVGSDLVLHGTDVQWHGLGEGHGLARRRTLTVRAAGRRHHRPSTVQVHLPAADGSLADRPAEVVALRPGG